MNDEKTIPERESSGELIPPQSPGELVQQRRQDYNRLVRTARLSNLLLEKCDFKMVPELLGIKESLLGRSISPTSKMLSYGLEDGTCVASVTWEVTFKHKSRNLMKCTASYIISYDGIKDSSEEAVSTFIDNVGKTATYAYFRALYAHFDWAASIGSQPLPVLQLQP